jgi:predicted transcriptional regulator
MTHQHTATADDPGPLVLPLDGELLRQVFSPQRTRLLGELRRSRGHASLISLARALDREPSHVSRDITYLEGLRLVARERHGRQVRIRAVPRPLRIEWP